MGDALAKNGNPGVLRLDLDPVKLVFQTRDTGGRGPFVEMRVNYEGPFLSSVGYAVEREPVDRFKFDLLDGVRVLATSVEQGCLGGSTEYGHFFLPGNWQSEQPDPSRFSIRIKPNTEG